MQIAHAIIRSQGGLRSGKPWDESKHPRQHSGSHGGEFASKGIAPPRRGEFTLPNGRGVIMDKHGVQYPVVFRPHLLMYSVGFPSQAGIDAVLRGGDVAAYAKMSAKNAHQVDQVMVTPDYQRRGVATALYNHIERHIGAKLVPSDRARITRMGAAFWRSRQ